MNLNSTLIKNILALVILSCSIRQRNNVKGFNVDDSKYESMNFVLDNVKFYKKKLILKNLLETYYRTYKNNKKKIQLYDFLYDNILKRPCNFDSLYQELNTKFIDIRFCIDYIADNKKNLHFFGNYFFLLYRLIFLSQLFNIDKVNLKPIIIEILLYDAIIRKIEEYQDKFYIKNYNYSYEINIETIFNTKLSEEYKLNSNDNFIEINKINKVLDKIKPNSSTKKYNYIDIDSLKYISNMNITNKIKSDLIFQEIYFFKILKFLTSYCKSSYSRLLSYDIMYMIFKYLSDKNYFSMYDNIELIEFTIDDLAHKEYFFSDTYFKSEIYKLNLYIIKSNLKYYYPKHHYDKDLGFILPYKKFKKINNFKKYYKILELKKMQKTLL